MNVDLQKAKMFATLANQKQFRKYTGEPYVEHCIRVSNILHDYGFGREDNTILAAALLHDTIEDTDTTYEKLVAYFGDNVASLVMQVTNQWIDPKIPRAIRCYRNQQQLLCQSIPAKIIKLADTYDNAQSIVIHDPKFARIWCQEKLNLFLDPQMYRWEAVPKELYNKTMDLLIKGLHI